MDQEKAEMENMDLGKISTKQLVEELGKSEKLSDLALKISIFALVGQIIIAILANLDKLIPL